MFLCCLHLSHELPPPKPLNFMLTPPLPVPVAHIRLCCLTRLLYHCCRSPVPPLAIVVRLLLVCLVLVIPYLLLTLPQSSLQHASFPDSPLLPPAYSIPSLSWSALPHLPPTPESWSFASHGHVHQCRVVFVTCCGNGGCSCSWLIFTGIAIIDNIPTAAVVVVGRFGGTCGWSGTVVFTTWGIHTYVGLYWK